MKELEDVHRRLKSMRNEVPPRKKGENKYIGKSITTITLRDYILDNGITDEDVILLNPSNFCDLMEDYRKEFDTAMPIPYKITGVLIEEGNSVPKDRISLVIGDSESYL